MSKVIKVLGILVLVGAVIAVGAVAVQAQGNLPEKPRASGDCECGGRGAGLQGDQGKGYFSIDKESVHAHLAEVLGISLDEFEAAIAEGETLFSLAERYDVDFEALRQVMLEAHKEALEDAVAEGKITQEQADWMLERWNAMGGNLSPGQGSREGGHRFQGSGGGRMGKFGGCPSAIED